MRSRLAERNRLRDFQGYRDQFDPGRFFENDFLMKLLGVPASVA